MSAPSFTENCVANRAASITVWRFAPMPLKRLCAIGAVATIAAVTGSGCASSPIEHAAPQVASLAADRGYPVPQSLSVTPAVTPAGDPTVSAHITELLAQPLTESSCVELALLNSPALRLEYAKLGIQIADVMQASQLSNPTLSGALWFPSQNDAARRFDLGLVTPLAELLLFPARQHLAQMEYQQAVLATSQTLLDYIAQVQTAYYAAVTAQQRVQMHKIIRQSAEAASTLAEQLTQAGNYSALDLALAQAQASQARLDEDAARAAANAAENSLNQMMGLNADASWEVRPTLAAPVSEEDSLETLHKLAALKRVDLQGSAQQTQWATDNLALVQNWRWLGNVDLGVQFERDTDRLRLLGPALSLELPVFNQGQARLASAQATLAAAQAQQDLRAVSADNELQGAYDALSSSRKRIQRLRDELIPQREAVVQQTLLRVNYMLASVFDLLRARSEEYQAYQDYLDAVGDYWQTRVRLSHAVGARLPSDALIGSAEIAPRLNPVPAKEGADPHAHHHH